MDIPSLLGWGHWLGLGLDYIVAGLFIAAGIYLAVFFNVAATNPLFWLLHPARYVGYALIGLGLVMGAVTYGKSVGAAECNAAWREKNLESKIARLEQERDAKAAAAKSAADNLQKIATEKETADEKVADYQTSIARLAGELAVCRRASADDDRRLCAILGPGAAGCASPR